MPFKVCPQCKKQVGPRTQSCDCGHSFSKSEKTTKQPLTEHATVATNIKSDVEKPVSTAKFSVFGKIGTPAGPCPITPEGYRKGWPDGPATDESVKNWAINASRLFDGRMTVEAVVYYARQFWEINGPEYRGRILDLIVSTLQPQSNQESMENY